VITNKNYHQHLLHSLYQQRGVATLFVSLMMLFSLTMIAVFTAKTNVTEHLVAANDYRAKQALEAAQAGIEQGQAEIMELQTTNVNGYLQLDQIDGNTDILQGFIDLDTDVNFFRVTGTPGTLPNNSTYSLTYENVDRTGGAFDPSIDNYLVRVTSVGTSDDGSGIKQMEQLIMLVPLLANAPDAALTTKDEVTISGNVHIYNMITDVAVRAGGTYLESGAAKTHTTIFPFDDKDLNVVQNDASYSTMTGDQFFFSFFGQSKSEIKAQATQIICNNCNASLGGLTGQVIWVNPTTTGNTPRVNANTTIGSATQPVILIIEGGANGFTFNGNAEIFGLLYVIGDWDNSGGGSAAITGAAVAEGHFDGTGTPAPTYDATILNRLNGMGTIARIPGSWKDF